MVSNPFGRTRRLRERLRSGLEAGGQVSIDAKLRRTSARGWGAWTDARLELGSVPGGSATWHVEDPTAVGVASVHGPVNAAFALGARVGLRPVRFATEGFWGTDSEIVVVEHERSTIELAVLPELVEPLARRLEDLLQGG
ncbi:MAG: hypothetical protein H6519_00805 [Microthrixaceae bacterium]|nr:hypothetical protein [Acidimicrobiales bacterium]MCB9402955.1 hypothetical protein [Microthrixaceae bacterium]